MTTVQSAEQKWEVMKMKDKIHWIYLGDGEYKCPKCGRKFIYGLDVQTLSKYFPSCPNCGTKMGEEANE